MDAIKFIKERNRMCEMYRLKRCEGCPANNPNNYGGEGVACIMIDKIDAERLVPIVEKWATAHPYKTRQSVFLSHYPKAEVDDAGFLKVCPLVVEGSDYKDSCKCGYITCERCSRNYWSIVVEEEK